MPGLAERVLEGHEGDYLDFFLRNGTWQGQGVPGEVREAFVGAYRGKDSLRAAFEHYRAMDESAAQVAQEFTRSRLTMPVVALGGRPIGDTLYKQLLPYADELHGEVIPECGHIIPLDRPEALLRHLLPDA